MRLPYANQNITSSTGFYLGIPVGAAAKAANVAQTALVFFDIPENFYEGAFNRILLGRSGGSTGSGDCYLRLKADSNPITLTYQIKTTTTVHMTGTISGLVAGKSYCAGVIINPTYIHVFVASTDGTVEFYASQATTGAYVNAMTSPEMFNFIGGASSGTTRPYMGGVENVTFIQGTFPEVSNAPDPTLAKNIANGSQSLDTLHSLFTGGARKSRYVMASHTDLSDIWELATALTKINEATVTNKRAFPHGPIRPCGVSPMKVGDQVSQVTFGTVGDITTASSNVKIGSGTYSTSLYPTVTSMRARLVGVTSGTVFRDWTALTTGSGTWTANQFTGVLAQPEFMMIQFAGFNSAGAIVTPVVCSHGLRGVGFHSLNSGQSQLMYLWSNGGGFTPENGINLLTTIQEGTLTGGVESAVKTIPRMLTAHMDAGVGAARGILQAAKEINAKFPGYPIQFSTVGKSGEPIFRFTPISPTNVDAGGGYYYNRFQRLAEHFGVIPPYLLQLVGHSSGSDSSYRIFFEAMLAEFLTRFGAPIKVLSVDVPRYSGTGTSSSYTQVRTARRMTRQWCQDNSSISYEGPSYGVVYTSEIGSDPHPANTDQGQGRSGSLMAWHCMMAVRAVPDEPVSVVEARTVQASNRLFVKLGPIN